MLVNVLVTHTNPHEDEVTAITLVCEDTSGRFIGARNATIVCPKSDAELAQYAGRSDTLFFGIGAKYRSQCPGRVFDEHGEKHKGNCCADLVANFLGNRESLKRLLNEVRKHDLKSSIAPAALSTVMKARYRHSEERKVIDWASQAVSSLYHHVLGGETLTVTDDVKNEFEDITSGVYMEVGQAHKARPEIFQFLLELFHKASIGSELTDIGSIFYIMRQKDQTRARAWLRNVAHDLVIDQIMLDQGAKEFRYRTEIEIGVDFSNVDGNGYSTCPVRVAFIESDNRRMIDVFRRPSAGGCEILVQRNSKGQVSIFTDKKARLNLDVLAQMIRFAENALAQGSLKSWSGLAKDGLVEGIEQWYYFREAGSLMNGSTTNPQAKPTRLTFEHFVEIFEHAFTYKGMQAFMARYRVFGR